MRLSLGVVLLVILTLNVLQAKEDSATSGNGSSQTPKPAKPVVKEDTRFPWPVNDPGAGMGGDR